MDVRKALKKIMTLYVAGQKPTFKDEFDILENHFKGDLEQTAIKWIKNFYRYDKSSIEAFKYLESKLNK